MDDLIEYPSLRKSHLSYDSGLQSRALTRVILPLEELNFVETSISDCDEIMSNKFIWTEKNSLEASPTHVYNDVSEYMSIKKQAHIKEIVKNIRHKSIEVVDALGEHINKGNIIPTNTFNATRKIRIKIKEKGYEFWEEYLKPIGNFISEKKPLPNIELPTNYKEKAMELYRSV